LIDPGDYAKQGWNLRKFLWIFTVKDPKNEISFEFMTYFIIENGGDLHEVQRNTKSDAPENRS